MGYKNAVMKIEVCYYFFIINGDKRFKISQVKLDVWSNSMCYFLNETVKPLESFKAMKIAETITLRTIKV